MVQLSFRMHPLFNRQRFGQPQFIAGSLLFVFLLQCGWLIRSDLRSERVSFAERMLLAHGLAQWRGKSSQFTIAELSVHNENEDADHPGGLTHPAESWDPNHSSWYYLVSSAPMLLWRGSLENDSVRQWGWLACAPNLFFSLFLGVSLWYVARRLYGNEGGYIALLLFCFSPGIVRVAAGLAQPEAGAAWGAFGAIFTGIGVAHTLYAPREVVLWNWRRIVLLGIAVAMSVGCQFSLVIALPLVLAFMLYLAPMRKRAALVIWGSACAIGAGLLFASYFFHAAEFWNGLRHASYFPFNASAYLLPATYSEVMRQIIGSAPVLLIAVPAALIVYARWPRARYFGNTAPLLVSFILLVLALGSPHYPGLGFRLIAEPFLFLFVAGIAADAVETRHRPVVMPAIAGLLASYALWSLIDLART